VVDTEIGEDGKEKFSFRGEAKPSVVPDAPPTEEVAGSVE